MKKSALRKSVLSDSKLTKIRYVINGLIAMLIYYIIPVKKRKGEYWLIGGHLGEMYDDNSKAFFEYIINNKKDQEIYWVLNKGSIADQNNKYRRNVIYRGSINAFLYCFRCRCIIVSHSFADVMPIFYKLKDLFNIKSIYLFHGIYGLKKVATLKDNYYSCFDIINSVGNFEKDIKIEYMNIKEEQIKIMGLPRYDKLYNTRISNGNIMVMFTWRTYTEEEDGRNKYFNNIKSFLTNEKLLEYLRKNEIKINVVLHSFAHKYFSFIKEIESENVIIMPKNIDIQSELIKNSLLITDYSSVAWDFMYMNKPVIFYHFDLEEYMKERGSYIDLKNDLFGEVAYKEDTLVLLIIKYIKSKFNINNDINEKIKNYFKYTDNKNCERIYEEAIELLDKFKV